MGILWLSYGKRTMGIRKWMELDQYEACRLRDRKGRAILCLRLTLGVGTPRALHSECHPRHSFTYGKRTMGARKWMELDGDEA